MKAIASGLVILALAGATFLLWREGAPEPGLELARDSAAPAEAAAAPALAATAAPVVTSPFVTAGKVELQAGGGRLAGRVLDAQRRPKAGATVRLETSVEIPGSNGPVLVRTREDGTFAILGLPAIDFLVDAYDDTRCLEAAQLARISEVATTEVELVLSEGVKVEGTVTDSEKAPVAEATVVATWAGGAADPVARRFVTGDAGHYELRGFRAGSIWNVVVEKPGYYPWGDTQFTAQEDASLALTIVRVSSVAGRIEDPRGAPLANARVELDQDRSTSSDAEGRFVFADVRLHDSPSSLAAATGDLAQQGYLDGAIEPGKDYADLVIVLRTQGRVHGRVTDRLGRPLEGVTVSANPASKPHALDGAFALEGPRLRFSGRGGAGDLKLASEVQSVLFQRAVALDMASFEIVRASSQEFAATPAPKLAEGLLRLRSQDAIQGPVSLSFLRGAGSATRISMTTEFVTGQPAGERRLRDRPHSAVTDAEGNYSIVGLVPGEYEIVPAAAGRFLEGENPQAEIRSEGDDVTCDLVMVKGAKLRVRVEPVPSGTEDRLRIVLARDDSTSEHILDAAPEVLLSNLRAGEYALLARVGDDRIDRIPLVRLEYEQVTTVTVNLRPAPRVRGRVADSAGAGIADAAVTLNSEGQPGTNQGVKANADGTFEFRAQDVGDHRISVEAGGFVAPPAQLLKLDPGSVTWVDLVVSKPGQVSGNVTDSRGAPLGNVAVFLRQGDERLDATSDENGRFLFAEVRPGRHQVYARTQDRLSCTRSAVVVVADRTTDLRLRLEPSLVISGRVESRRGAPLEGLTVVATGIENPTIVRQGKCDAAGRFAVEGLYGGPYRVAVQEREGDPLEVDLEAGRPAPALVLPIRD